MYRAQLRASLSTLCRILPALGLKDTAKSLLRNERRDDLAAWLSDEQGFGVELWREIAGGLDVAEHLALEFNSPRYSLLAKQARNAYETSNTLINELVAPEPRRATPPPRLTSAQVRASLRVVPSPQPVVVASSDGRHVAALPPVRAERTDTVPVSPLEVA